MQTVTVTRIVHATPETVWELLADVTAVSQWHPQVATVDLLSTNAVGLGATRRCNFHDGTSVREEVTSVEKGRRLRLTLSEFSLPMKSFEVEVTLTPTSRGQTQVSFEMVYEVKFGIFGRAMNALVVRGQMSKLLNRVLAGLDHHSVTGELIGQDFVASAA
ncbi:MAG: SRPBCC family protein [Myxococcota bacterium]